MPPTLWRGAAIGAAAAALILTGLGRVDLFNPDEPREAEMAREMFVSGDLLVPRLNGEPFLEKPPLHYWLVTAAYTLAGGPSEAAARAAPALAGILGVLLTWWFGRRMVGETAAAVGALVLLTSWEYWWLARRCMIDMPLALMVLVSCGALYRGITGRGVRRFGWLVLGYAAAGAAVLLKGLIGLGVPILAVAGFLLARRDARGLLRHWLIPGAIAALLPAATWAVLLWRRLGDAAMREFVWVNNVQRFIGGAAGKGHEQPFYYYGPALLLDLLPWSLVLPFALFAAWRFLRSSAPATPASPSAASERGGLLFVLCWFVAPLLVLSIASTKRGIYLLPIYPAAALLCGWLAARAGGAPWDAARRKEARPALWLAFAAALLMASIVQIVILRLRPFDWVTPTVLVALLLPIGLAGWRALRARAAVPAAILCAGMTGVALLALALAALPRVVAEYATQRPVGVALRRFADAGDRIALHDFQQGMLGGVLFYAGRTFPNLRTTEAFEAHLAGSPSTGPRPVILARQGAYETIVPGLRIRTIAARRFARSTPPVGRPPEALVLVVAGEIGDNAAPRAPRRPPS